MMKKKWILIVTFFSFLVACEKSDNSDLETPTYTAPNNDTIETVESIEEKFGITRPNFYTGLINGVRHTYQASSGSDYTPFCSISTSSSNGGTRRITTGFFSHLTLVLQSDYGFYNIPDTSQIFYLNKSYSSSNGSNIPNDTLRYFLTYSNNEISTRSDCCHDLNKNATLKITQLTPAINRSKGRYRAEIDSLFFRTGGDTIIFTDFIIQSYYTLRHY